MASGLWRDRTERGADVIDEMQEWEQTEMELIQGGPEAGELTRMWQARVREARGRIIEAEKVQLVLDAMARIEVTNGLGKKVRFEKKRKLRNWGWCYGVYRGETPKGIIYPWLEDRAEDGPKKLKVNWRFVGMDERLRNEEATSAELRKWVMREFA